MCVCVFMCVWVSILYTFYHTPTFPHTLYQLHAYDSACTTSANATSVSDVGVCQSMYIVKVPWMKKKGFFFHPLLKALKKACERVEEACVLERGQVHFQ